MSSKDIKATNPGLSAEEAEQMRSMALSSFQCEERPNGI